MQWKKIYMKSVKYSLSLQPNLLSGTGIKHGPTLVTSFQFLVVYGFILFERLN